jgi:hypothetical protein
VAEGITMTQGPVDKILDRSPGMRSTVVDHGGWWMLTVGGVLNIHGPLDLAEVRRIAAHPRVDLIQFAGAFEVPASLLRLLDEHVLASHQGAGLRTTFNGHGAFDDLGFLRHLPRLRSLKISGGHALDLQPIVDHVALEHLGLGGDGVSLRPLQGYPSLRTLFFHEEIRGLETIGTLHNLEGLTIGGHSPDSLSYLQPLAKLTSLAFSLVAPKRFEDLCALPALEKLSIRGAKGLEVAAMVPLNRIPRLRQLVLAELPRITDLEWLNNPTLQAIELEGMKGLRSYASLAGLPDLRTLVIKDVVTAAELAELAVVARLEAVHVYQSYLPGLQAAFASAPLPFALREV